MLNTNESNGGASAVDELRRFLDEQLFTERGLQWVILESATSRDAHPRRIQAVEIRAAAIEIGSIQKRVHAHWVMKITHSDLQINVGRMQRALQDLCRENTSFCCPYAHCRLLNGAPENYALKEVEDEIDFGENS